MLLLSQSTHALLQVAIAIATLSFLASTTAREVAYVGNPDRTASAKRSISTSRRAIQNRPVQLPLKISPPADPLLHVPLANGFCHFAPLSWTVMDGPEPGKAISPLAASAIQSAQAKNKTNRGFEINRPTRVLPDRDGLRTCTITLVQHSFTNSYGHPAIAQYSPDQFQSQNCADPTKWIFLEMGIEGRGKGRQFDRLGSVQLDGIEVLRTDNQEPSRNGTIWNFTKEMNKYYDVFRKPRTLLYDLPNIVNDIYVSPLNYTLTLTAYVAKDANCKLPPLSRDFAVVLPLSKRNFSENSFFSLGEDFVEKQIVEDGITSLTIPRNARSALVEIYASGTAKDEFWYANLPSSLFSNNKSQAGNYTYPTGPFRELQILIDGKLAGVAQPFPVIFTGGISPFFWRPQVAFGAFDQPTYLIDISPFLGQLTDDKAHEFQLKVVSAEKDQAILAWFISGNIQVQLDSSNERTTGQITKYEAPNAGDYSIKANEQGNVSENGFIHAEVQTAKPRTIHIEGSLKPGSAPAAYPVTWSQSVTYSSVNDIRNNTSTTKQTSDGSFVSQHNGQDFLQYKFSFPFTTNSVDVNTTLDHGYHIDLALSPAASSTFKEPCSQKIDMTQNGEAVSIVDPNQPQTLIGGYGSTFTSYKYEDNNGFSFGRDNSAFNQTVTHDDVSGTLASKAGSVLPPP